MRQWKVGERILAKLLGCERVPLTGRARGKAMADLYDHWRSVEVKTRKALPVFLADAMDSAVRGAEFAQRRDGKKRMPVVVLHADHTPYRNSLVVVRLGDMDDYFGFCTGSPTAEAGETA